MKMLSDKEVDIVFKWLGVSPASSPASNTRTLTLPYRAQFLVNFFHGQGDGVPLEDLRNAKYRGELMPGSQRVGPLLTTFIHRNCRSSALLRLESRPAHGGGR